MFILCVTFKIARGWFQNVRSGSATGRNTPTLSIKEKRGLRCAPARLNRPASLATLQAEWSARNALKRFATSFWLIQEFLVLQAPRPLPRLLLSSFSLIHWYKFCLAFHYNLRCYIEPN